MNQTIAAYADWEGLEFPAKLGILHVRRSNQREIFEFEYDPSALTAP